MSATGATNTATIQQNIPLQLLSNPAASADPIPTTPPGNPPSRTNSLRPRPSRPSNSGISGAPGTTPLAVQVAIKAIFSKLKRALKKEIWNCNFWIACVALVATVVFGVPTYYSLKYTVWTGRKDFIAFCKENNVSRYVRSHYRRTDTSPRLRSPRSTALNARRA